MPASQQLLDDLAGAVLDGAAVDWEHAESSAGADARFVRHLRLVASVARVHRDALPDASLTSSGPVLSHAPPPERWGHLRLLERVGRGAFGEVFRAWDTRLDREVALKLLTAAPSRSGTQPDTIIQEGRLLARVRHPNVVTIHGAEQIGDQIGLWMEFVRGQSLEQLLRQGIVFTSPEVVRIGLDLAGAVSAVHAAGLLHRDIKAHNVIRAEDGRIVLMDFGTGKELDDNSASDLAGTPLYLAPEVMAGKPATVQSDIYSLGVLLYHLLTRSYPVRGRTIRDVRRAHERHERVGLRTSRPDVRPALARVIERACDADPAQRYANVAALTHDLTALQRRAGVSRIWYALAGVAAIVVVAAGALEIRARVSGDRRSLGARLGSLVGTSSPIHNPNIIVLPFRNLAGDERERLVDSLTVGLIRHLATVEGLAVRSQNSSFMLKTAPLDLKSIGDHLGVNLVVEGDAQLNGETLSIRASLVSVADDVLLWNDGFSRVVKSESDLAGIVNDITREIVERLSLRLRRVQKGYETLDLVTLDLFWRARAIQQARGPGARAAIPLFKQVIARDSKYAPAYAALAGTYGSLATPYPIFGGGAMSPAEAAAEMRPLLDQALALDPDLADGHSVQGYLHAFERRWTDAEMAFRRAIDLDPSQTIYSTDFVLSTLQPWGRLDEAMAVLRAALKADPMSLDVRRVMAQIQLGAGLFDDALANCQHVLQVNPSFPFADAWCDRALMQKGRVADALANMQKNPERNEGWIGYAYTRIDRRAEAEQIAARNGDLPQRQALIYAGLGDKDRAFEALERLAELNAHRAGSYLTYPELASLRGDPRVQQLRDKLGFPR